MMSAISGLTIIVIVLLALSIRLMCCRPKHRILPPADLIPKVGSTSYYGNFDITLLINVIFQDSVVTIKRNANKANTFKVVEPKDHLECNSGSYSTTTTISINKNDLIPDIREHIPLPDPARYRNLSLNTISYLLHS